MKTKFTAIEKYKNHYINSFLILAIDTFISLLSSFAVIILLRLWLRTNITTSFAFYWVIVSGILSILSFYCFKTYRIVIRHMSLRDMVPFILVSIIKILFLFSIFSFFIDSVRTFHIFLASLVDGLLTFSTLMVLRVLMIIVYDLIRRNTAQDKRQNVLICGTTDKSVALVKRLQNSPHYNVKGFLKNKEEYSHCSILGLNVYYYSGEESLTYFREKGVLDAILLPSESCAFKYKDSIVADATSVGVKILITPSIDETSNGIVMHNQIREVKIEDLLGRNEIVVAMDVIKNYFNQKVVMVTGAAGSIGSELCRQLATFGIKRLILFDNAETPMHYLRLELEERFKDLDFVPVIGDVRSKDRLDFVFKEYKPQVLFHAAAYKHVPLMEENPCEAVAVNVIGSRNVADKCLEYDVERMVMVSTDKAVNPTNVMGCTKRLAEIYVQSLGVALEKGEKQGKTIFVTTRFGNVLGSNGSVIPRFREQILKGGPVTVTHPDITRFFMTIPEACRLVMEAATLTSGNQIFVFDMGAPVKINDLARNMIKLVGLKPDIDIKIEYTGLRPGEKLYEEVLSNVENTLPTSNDRIRIAQVRNYNYLDAVHYFEQLSILATNVEINRMVSLMKEIVPEFISNNSIFHALDR